MRPFPGNVRAVSPPVGTPPGATGDLYLSETFPLEREEFIPLPNAAPIFIEHPGRLDVVGQRRHLLVPKEVLEEGEDALAAGRVGRDREEDARRERPGRVGAAVIRTRTRTRTC